MQELEGPKEIGQAHKETPAESESRRWAQLEAILTHRVKRWYIRLHLGPIKEINSSGPTQRTCCGEGPLYSPIALQSQLVQFKDYTTCQVHVTRGADRATTSPNPRREQSDPR